MIALLAIALSLETELPAFYRADVTSCAMSSVPGSIDSLFIYGNGIELGNFSVRGLDGQLWRGEVVLPEPDTTWLLWTVMQGVNGVRGCASETTAWPVVTGVEAAAAAEPLKLYDISGRRVERPLQRGVYFTSQRKRMVVWGQQ